MALRLRRRLWISAKRESIHLLLFIVFKDAEIRGLQVVNVLALFVRDDHVHAYFARFSFDGRRSSLTLGLLGRSGLRRLLRRLRRLLRGLLCRLWRRGRYAK